MCSYLEWQLNVEPKVLADFEARVRRDFAGPGPYPSLVISSESTAEPVSTTSHIPFAPPTSSSDTARPYISPSPAASPRSASRTVDDDDIAPSTPDVSHSNTTSPTSIASPRTPPDDMPGYPVDIAGEPRQQHQRSSRPHKSHRHPQTADSAATSLARDATSDPYAAAGEPRDAIVAPRGTRKRVASPTGRSKLQVGRDMYAYATRTVW